MTLLRFSSIAALFFCSPVVMTSTVPIQSENNLSNPERSATELHAGLFHSATHTFHSSGVTFSPESMRSLANLSASYPATGQGWR